MTLDEAIQHCIEKAEENNVRCADYLCAMEHIQLAKWLMELKEYKEQKTGRWIIEPGIGCKCSQCEFDIGNDLDWMEYVNYCPNCGARMEGTKCE